MKTYLKVALILTILFDIVFLIIIISGNFLLKDINLLQNILLSPFISAMLAIIIVLAGTILLLPIVIARDKNMHKRPSDYIAIVICTIAGFVVPFTWLIGLVLSVRAKKYII